MYLQDRIISIWVSSNGVYKLMFYLTIVTLGLQDSSNGSDKPAHLGSLTPHIHRLASKSDNNGVVINTSKKL